MDSQQSRSFTIAIFALTFLSLVSIVGESSRDIVAQSIQSAVSVPNTAAVSDFDSNLALHFTFDDGTATDQSSRSNNGTLTSGATIGSGKNGSGLDLSTSTGRVTLASDVIGTGSATFCTWYFARSTEANKQILGNAKLALD